MNLKRSTRCQPGIYAIIIGVCIMSVLFAGLFLWGLVKRHKKSKAKASSKCDTKATGIKDENSNSLALAPPPLTYLPPDSWNVRINDLIFDPETDYAQVLAEAQKFVAQATFPSQRERAPEEKMSMSVHPSKAKAKSMQTKLESGRAQGKQPTKPSWKNPWLFWQQRSKRSGEEGLGLGLGLGNASSTVAPRRLKRSVSGPLQAPPHYTSSRKGNSGPIYSDGMPLAPANRSNRSGTRSGSATPDRTGSGHLESPYEQLKPSTRLAYGPLYTV